MNRDQLFRFFFLGVFLFLLYQTLRILSPFYTGILGAIVLTLIFFPWHKSILQSIGPKRKNTAAVASTLLVVILIIVPFILLAWLVLNELPTFSPVIERFGEEVNRYRLGHSFQASWIAALEDRLEVLFDLTHISFQKIITTLGRHFVNAISAISRNLTRNIFLFAVNIIIMIFTLFFAFRDGPLLFKKAKDLLPMEDNYKDQIAQQLYVTVTAVVRGVFLVALAQGVLAAIGFLIIGTPSPVLLGFITMAAAMVPLVGTPAVWLPVTIYYFIQGTLWKGFFMVFWGFFVVGLVDNFLRPWLIGGKTRLPVLFLFFGLLGGVRVYGPMGLFLGPLVVALVIAFIKIYREEYSQKAPSA